MTVGMKSVKHGCYLFDTMKTILSNIGKKVDVVEHDKRYYKTINCGKIFLIHKLDCEILNT